MSMEKRAVVETPAEKRAHEKASSPKKEDPKKGPPKEKN